jgi:hypothetical protein
MILGVMTLIDGVPLPLCSWGALTRRWPQGFSVWLEDEALPEGYRHLKVRNRVVLEIRRNTGRQGGGESLWL